MAKSPNAVVGTTLTAAAPAMEIAGVTNDGVSVDTAGELETAATVTGVVGFSEAGTEAEETVISTWVVWLLGTTMVAGMLTVSPPEAETVWGLHWSSEQVVNTIVVGSGQ